MYLLKMANRNLKVTLSVGGWTYTNTNHHMDFITDASKRGAFISSAIQLINDYGFDGMYVYVQSYFMIRIDYPPVTSTMSGRQTLPRDKASPTW